MSALKIPWVGPLRDSMVQLQNLYSEHKSRKLEYAIAELVLNCVGSKQDSSSEEQFHTEFIKITDDLKAGNEVLLKLLKALDDIDDWISLSRLIFLASDYRQKNEKPDWYFRKMVDFLKSVDGDQLMALKKILTSSYQYSSEIDQIFEIYNSSHPNEYNVSVITYEHDGNIAVQKSKRDYHEMDSELSLLCYMNGSKKEELFRAFMASNLNSPGIVVSENHSYIRLRTSDIERVLYYLHDLQIRTATEAFAEDEPT
jgi:hypothetical protein